MLVIHAIGACQNNGTPTQQASAAVSMSYIDEYGRIAKRDMTFPLGNNTKNQADIRALALALMSVDKSFRKVKCVANITNQYVTKSISDPSPNLNAEIIKSLKSWVGYYEDLSIIVHKVADNEELTRLAALAKETSKTQRGSDTGTIVNG